MSDLTTKLQEGSVISEPSYNQDPIAAVSSGQLPAAIALIRLSGKGVHELARGFLAPRGSEAIAPRTMRLHRLIDPNNGQVLDEPMAVFFTGPHSFTGEDSVEIYPHGSSYLVSQILNMLYRNGFRPAEPGEFTRRAFLNGKLDLTQAEGIKELIEAQTHQQWMAARQLATGELARTIEEMRAKLIEVIAYLEARIDFPEDEDAIEKAQMEFVRDGVTWLKNKIGELVATYDNGRVATRGLAVTLVGVPNVGKSTLLNTLLGKNRAIVTEIPGTTRDYLEEECLIDGRLLRFIDTAGLRKTSEKVEQIGIESTLARMLDADVLLLMADSDESRDDLEDWVKNFSTKDCIRIKTKQDANPEPWPADWLALSCHSGVGLAELKEMLISRVDRYVSGLAEQTFITSARHMTSLQQALEALESFSAADAEAAYDECLAFELQGCARQLGAIIGMVGNDEILDQIFAQFCIGK